MSKSDSTARALDSSIIEINHSNGRMPDRAYYQLNGRTAMENYIDQKRK